MFQKSSFKDLKRAQSKKLTNKEVKRAIQVPKVAAKT